MIGVILLSHGSLAQSIIDTVQLITGPQESLRAFCLSNTDDMEVKRQELFDEIDQLDHGQGVVLLTDMFGGTPSNLAMSALGVKHIEVVAGFNLPMLIKLIEIRGKETLNEAAQSAHLTGRKYIQIASTLLEVKPRKHKNARS